MKGIKCDRCGKFYCWDINAPAECFTIFGSEPRGNAFFERHFCVRCYKELKKIVMGRKHNGDIRKQTE